MTKSDVSEVLKGFQKDKKGQGFDIVKVKNLGLSISYQYTRKAEKL